MLDLLHFYLEDDLATGAAHGNIMGAIRKSLYKDFYDVTYEGPQPDERGSSSEYTPPTNADGLYINEPGEPEDRPVDPRARSGNPSQDQPVKPYIPPTEFDHDADDPFGAALTSEAVRAMRSKR